MSEQTELNQTPVTSIATVSSLPSDSNPILTYLATLLEEALIGKMTPHGFLCSTSWWPTE
jgi:hypothetical protein